VLLALHVASQAIDELVMGDGSHVTREGTAIP
jgi:hypothetical protein